MSTTQIFNIKLTILTALTVGMLMIAAIPFTTNAQNLPEQANAGIDRGAEAADNETVDNQIKTLRSQLESLQAKLQALLPDRTDGGADSEEVSSELGEGSDSAVENGLSNLPEQASDRAKQVMQCLQPTRALAVGSQGNDVQQVQEFLKEKGFFDYSTATGYFGPITQEAIQAFQASEGIVSSGSPETTGFGLVGPQTRAALAQASCLSEGQTTDSDSSEDNSIEGEVEGEEVEESEVEENETDEV